MNQLVKEGFDEPAFTHRQHGVADWIVEETKGRVRSYGNQAYIHSPAAKVVRRAFRHGDIKKSLVGNSAHQREAEG